MRYLLLRQGLHGRLDLRRNGEGVDGDGEGMDQIHSERAGVRATDLTALEVHWCGSPASRDVGT